MTPAGLAAFATSDQGKLYGRVCERWGIDPAAGMTDDVLAYNLRAALAVGELPDPEPQVTPDGGISYSGGIR